MMNSLTKQLVVLFCGLLMVVCSCAEKTSTAESKIPESKRPAQPEVRQAAESKVVSDVLEPKKDADVTSEPDRPVKPEVKPAVEKKIVSDVSTLQKDTDVTSEPGRQPQSKVKVPVDPNIVASIGDFTITKQEFEKQLLMEIYPRGYESFGEQTELPDNEAVLMKMVAEKAMTLEARAQGYLKEDENLSRTVKRFRERRLANLLLQKQLQDKVNKVTVTEAEIQQRMKISPKLDRTKAEAMVKRTKVNMLLESYFEQINQKLHVTKLSENFPKAVQIYQRLLNQPKKPRKVPFIRNYQMREELTEEEKNIVLAKYDNGNVTLNDWFNALGEIAPPSRPKNLNTTAGVEQLLDRALRLPLLVTEAGTLGLDKDVNLLRQVKEYEDRMLLSRIKSDKYKSLNQPTAEEIVEHFNKNKEAFRTGRMVKVNMIRCENLKTALEAKAELDSGKDFESVRGKYSLEKKGKPFINTYASSEGIFWKDLWEADPNEVIGPIKGFYRNEVKWRIVKILEKEPGEIKEYSSDMDRRIKDKIMSERREALLEQYGRELLAKYPHNVYAERIKGIDPLDIP